MKMRNPGHALRFASAMVLSPVIGVFTTGVLVFIVTSLLQGQIVHIWALHMVILFMALVLIYMATICAIPFYIKARASKWNHWWYVPLVLLAIVALINSFIFSPVDMSSYIDIYASTFFAGLAFWFIEMRRNPKYQKTTPGD